MSQISEIIKKNKKLVQLALDSLKPFIIAEIEKKADKKITGSSVSYVKKVIEEMKI